jgi:hypothetical protein
MYKIIPADTKDVGELDQQNLPDVVLKSAILSAWPACSSADPAIWLLKT